MVILFVNSDHSSVIDRLSAPVCPHLHISTQERFWSLGITPFERPSIAGTTTSGLQKLAQFTYATVAEVSWSQLYELSSPCTD